MKILTILLVILLMFDPSSCEYNTECTKSFFISENNETISDFIRIEIINIEQNVSYCKIETATIN